MARREPVGYLQAVDPVSLQPQYPIYADGLKIGRDAEQCEVILSRDYVSRLHCSIAPQEGGILVTDLKTTNGTFVNGERIAQRLVREGEIVSLGKPDLRHFVFSRSEGSKDRAFVLSPQHEYRIGRAPDNDLPLANDPTVSSAHARIRVIDNRLTIEDLGSANGTFVNEHPIRHAKLNPSDEVWIGSTKLFFSFAPDGLHVSTRDTRNQWQLQAQNLSRTHRGKAILKNINLVVEPGEYVGVLGPSGAGKSTLLNALCGFQPATAGTVLMNGTSLYDSYDLFRNSIGYVPQDDIIHRELSVERSLTYTAQLRLPRDSTPAQISQNVTSVIETLSLGHVRENPVSNLSGGQRKRVSIGCELLTRPSLIFLDEPTSGLDPSTEEKLMKHFGRMAEQGQTVVLTTHILYNLDLLNLVVILARGRLAYFGPVGELCSFFHSREYPVSRPLDVFDVLEPDAAQGPDLREQRAEEYERRYLESPLYQKYVIGRGGTGPAPQRAPELTTAPGEAPRVNVHAREAVVAPPPKQRARRLLGLFDLRQLGILMRRMFDLKLSAPARLAVPLLTSVVLAVLTGTIDIGDQAQKEAARLAYEHDNQAGLNMLEQTKLMTGPDFLAMKYEGIPNFAIPLSVPLIMIMTAVFLGTLSACLEISGERSVYLRERSVNVKIPLYVSSKLPYLFMLTLIQCFVYVALASVLLHLESAAIIKIVLITTAVAWVSCVIGLFISSLDPTPGQNSVVLAVVAVLPQLILAGAMGPGFYHGMSLPAKAVACVLPARWGFEWMLTVLYDKPAWAQQVITGTEAGQMGFHYGDGVFSTNALALGLIGAGFFVATCISLKRYDKL